MTRKSYKPMVTTMQPPIATPPAGRSSALLTSALLVAGLVISATTVASSALAETVSGLAGQVWRDLNAQCTEGERPEYYTLELGGGITAELIYNDCLGFCGSGGCTTTVIVKDFVVEVLGSRPFVLRSAETSVIGWFSTGDMDCNSDANFESCLYALYWQKNAGPDNQGKLMHNVGDDVTDRYR